ncbi:hypothetical protein VOI54_10440 [Tamlana sp. 2201CG12-4]|uniref:hypothetical protein n=1 Tax=Tamlana sp. 2201CG12-4 TaxID=3112582 RepID=UPI002DBF943F|nr:hypothetical protein [Tamlana sp. 2201CG12-4]MEC3907438.1 hypothetical protein [Tamlana sp. 2201CG12-4]
MNNIIIGNGIDIQFGGLEYTNKSIIERAFLNLKTGDFSPEVYTKKIEIWIYILHLAVPNFLNGHYDQLAVLNDEKEELENFKRNYSKKVSISDIGFEYYFLLNELHCRKFNLAFKMRKIKNNIKKLGPVLIRKVSVFLHAMFYT